MKNDLQQEILTGGNVSQVIKTGNIVRRATGAWSKSVHDLLLHLEKNDFAYSPRYLGVDEDGYEMLTYIKGEVGNDPVKAYMRADNVLIKVAKVLRQFHDLTESFAMYNHTWQMKHPDEHAHEVICHYDFAPYNTVFREGLPVGIIDFDTCGPGPRIWDIAYTLFTFVPLSSQWQDENGDVVYYQVQQRRERHSKIQLFCDSYGIDYNQNIFDNLIDRLLFLCDFIMHQVQSGDESYERMFSEGHLDYYKNQIEFIKKESPYWL